ncbi:hypothetical protein BD410DRAFT_726688 [Rickenella mellea]|uniref:YMC020W-like alpha/beta hydrolase domain-containing protein n=1 Tax=Rickenella mellea TaxID=50990 RepID=A0A4Y7PWK8_9AGAM|nr:hypothetical protein BD410DRAFT_726688 [Rickenella mellea]
MPSTTSTSTAVAARKTPSVRSEPAAGSAWWYNWYASSNAAQQTQQPRTGPEEKKTEAEMVKEEALARPDPPISTPAPAQSSPSSVNETATANVNVNVNPIAATVSSNSKGWASFFSSSRALTTKMVKEKGEEGMEVMDLDDEEGQGQGQGQALLPKTPSVKSTHSTSTETRTAKPKRSTPPAPLTNSESIKRKVVEEAKRSPSPAPSKKSMIAPPTPKLPNLVLPTFDDTFRTLPRSRPWPKERERERTLSSTALTLKKTLGYVSDVLFASPERAGSDAKGKGRQIDKALEEFGKELPRAWDVAGQSAVRDMVDVKSCKKIVIIGIHGWYPGIAVRTVLGEPTGTSTKFASMMGTAVEKFAETHGIAFEDVVKIPLEGEGKIGHRVQKLYQNLTENDEWMNALHSADVIFVATHSQGCIVSTHLISRLISEGHIRTAANSDFTASVQAAASLAAGGAPPMNPVGKQRICLLALCGIHLGPLAYLHKSSLVQPYIQWFESPAASELFEFQDMDSQVSKDYVNALRQVLNHKVKMVYIASMNDQVVPIYSGSFTSVSHPLILRALYIDGDAYGSSDFLTNLLVLLLKIRNAGLSDGSLLAHLSEATAGSLNGVGHSTAYEELATFSLAVDYLFLSNDGLDNHPDLDFEPFNARSALNDYEIPWALRDLIADERVVYLFSHEFATLRDAFDEWQPRTTILRELKRKLEPIRRLKLASRL